MVDACFVLLKQRYRSSDIGTVQQLGAVAGASAKCNTVQLFDWDWREWDSFLALKFKPLPGITKLQHLYFSKDTPGYVIARTSIDAPEIEIKLLKHGVMQAK